MFFEIVLCFFTVFGILQVLALLWDIVFYADPQNATLVVKIDEETDLKMLCLRLKKQKASIVFLHENISEEKLEILRNHFEFAGFVSKENSAEELLDFI